MIVATELTSLIGPLVSGRIYPGTAPDAVAPYITYFRVAAIEENDLSKNGGLDNLTNTRLQINIWALNYGDAQNKAAAIKSALKGWSVTNIVLDEQDLQESDPKLHGVLIDVSTWHN